MGFERSRRRIAERMRAVLAGEGFLRTDTRRRIGMEDESFASPATVEVLDTAERHGADPDVALAAATTVALLGAFVRVRTEIEPGSEADAINAGDLLLSLAYDEAGAAGTAALERTLDAAVTWIASGDPRALLEYDHAIRNIAAGANAERPRVDGGDSR